MILSAIDIGSNAIRLVIAQVYNDNGKPFFQDQEVIRVGIRLGDEVFLKKRISDYKIGKLIKSLIAFGNIMEVYEVVGYRAVATSALREAENGKEVVEILKKETGIKVEILSGQDEAKLIFENHIENVLDPDNSYMYIDVGGGSTEISIYYRHKLIDIRSFNIGALKVLYNLVDKSVWEEMREWVKSRTKNIDDIYAIGSGGNIKRVYKLENKKVKFQKYKPLKYSEIKYWYDLLSSYTFEDRVKKIGLKPDRADVIIPALRIYLEVMKEANIEKMYVPEMGLADGVIHSLYKSLTIKNNALKD